MNGGGLHALLLDLGCCFPDVSIVLTLLKFTDTSRLVGGISVFLARGVGGEFSTPTVLFQVDGLDESHRLWVGPDACGWDLTHAGLTNCISLSVLPFGVSVA